MADNFDLQEKGIFQIRPSVTSIVTAFELLEGRVIGKELWLCNTSASLVTWSLWADIDGTTFDNNAILLDSQTIRGKQSERLKDLWWPLFEENSGFGVQVSIANSVNFTLFGGELIPD